MEEKSHQSFEDLLIWKEAMRFSVEIYQLFRDNKDYGFRDQIQRASVSVPSNIAEGFERQTDKEFVKPEICIRKSITALNCFKISHVVAVFDFTIAELCLSLQTA